MARLSRNPSRLERAVAVRAARTRQSRESLIGKVRALEIRCALLEAEIETMRQGARCQHTQQVGPV